MKRAILQRIKHASHGTPGELILPGGQEFCTVEAPWQDNKPFVSCVPAGTYRVRRDNVGRFNYYVLLDVPERSDIELHPANFFINPNTNIQELEGCIAPGMRRIPGYDVSVSQSKIACETIVHLMGCEDFELEIIPPKTLLIDQ